MNPATPAVPLPADDAYVRFYDFIVPHTDELPLVTALARAAAEGREPRVLELGAGSGRLAVPLAQAGVRVTAVDWSPAMLALAQAKMAGKALPGLSLVQGDMRRPPLDAVPKAAFDLVMFSSNTFCLITDPDAQSATLAMARERLKPGGRLYLEQFNPPGFFAEQHGQRDIVHLHTRLNPATGLKTSRSWSLMHDAFRQEIFATTFIEEFLLGPAGGSVRHMFTEHLRYNTFPELKLRLERAGFGAISALGGFRNEPLDAKALKMVVTAKAE